MAIHHLEQGWPKYDAYDGDDLDDDNGDTDDDDDSDDEHDDDEYSIFSLQTALTTYMSVLLHPSINSISVARVPSVRLNQTGISWVYIWTYVHQFVP